MTADRTLARVDADVRAGYRPLARQRLRSLVASQPARLDVRERLAQLYREDGDAAQAGRWSYLSAERRADEVAAFHRAYGEPQRRMHALAWHGPEDAAGGEVAARLRQLRQDAEAAAGRPLSFETVSPEPQQSSSTVGDAVFAVIAGVVLLLLVLGAIDVVVHGVRLVADWLG